MKLFDIGEISRQFGIPPSTLRYYEEIGLIKSVGRRGLRRQFDAGTTVQLSLIALGKSAGFTLGEISGMFGRDGRLDIPRASLRRRAEHLDLEIKKLLSLRKLLRHVADCPAPTHMECLVFRRLVRSAGKSFKPVR